MQARAVDLAIGIQCQARYRPQMLGPHRLGQALLQPLVETFSAQGFIRRTCTQQQHRGVLPQALQVAETALAEQAREFGSVRQYRCALIQQRRADQPQRRVAQQVGQQQAALRLEQCLRQIQPIAGLSITVQGGEADHHVVL